MSWINWDKNSKSCPKCGQKTLRFPCAECGHGKDKASTSKEQPLDKLTDGELEEVEKLKAWESWLEQRHMPLWEKLLNKKAWHDGTLTPENIREAFASKPSGKKNVDAIHSDVDPEDNKSAASREFTDSVNSGKGKGGDKKITNIDDIPRTMRGLLEMFKELPQSGKAPLKKTSAGDAKFGNPHESGNSDDIYGSSVDDKQTYIGKPARDGKDKDEPKSQ